MMKATGIVRRIDDLGRIVLPREVRKSLKLREGDPMELFIGEEGTVVLKKFEPMGPMKACAQQYVESLYKTSGSIAIITDRDRVIAISGAAKRDYIDKEITPEVSEIIESKQPIVNTRESTKVSIVSDEKTTYFHQIIFPIISDGDPVGAVILLESDPLKENDHSLYDISKTASIFFGKMMED